MHNVVEAGVTLKDLVIKRLDGKRFSLRNDGLLHLVVKQDFGRYSAMFSCMSNKFSHGTFT